MQRKGPERPKGARGIGYLYADELPRVIARLIKLGVCESEAEELAHEILLAYVRKPRAPMSRRTVRQWLRSAARKKAANWRRLARHRFEILTSPDALDALAHNAATVPDAPTELVAWRVQVQRIPPKERAAYLLHVEGCTTREIADRLNMARSSVQLRLKHARALLAGKGMRHAKAR